MVHGIGTGQRLGQGKACVGDSMHCSKCIAKKAPILPFMSLLLCCYCFFFFLGESETEAELPLPVCYIGVQGLTFIWTEIGQMSW